MLEPELIAFGFEEGHEGLLSWWQMVTEMAEKDIDNPLVVANMLMVNCSHLVLLSDTDTGGRNLRGKAYRGASHRAHERIIYIGFINIRPLHKSPLAECHKGP